MPERERLKEPIDKTRFVNSGTDLPPITRSGPDKTTPPIPGSKIIDKISDFTKDTFPKKTQYRL